ncbi:MAG TPA: haloalkane dehalogenase [Candidatus Binatia bacterium]|nr:haloalkane dehalogenase [Candidatus Binatia bacterium]
MPALRTPDDRFRGLPDYPFAPHWHVLRDGLRMHYLDEGPRDGPVVLLLHGEPTWSYLYRHMIPLLARAGLRAVAPDLVGFGKSDKPAAIADYSYQRHMDWLREWLEALDLKGITLVCQDWGALLGLRMAAELEPRFARIVCANGFLATARTRPPPAFRIWRAFARFSPVFPIGRIVAAGCATRLPPEVIAAYDAPFPSAQYKAGARAFPRLVPIHPDDPAVPANREAWEKLCRWRKPFLTVFGSGDPIMRGADRVLQKHVPGSQGQPHGIIRAGHFIQEDQGPELARRTIEFVRASR